MQGYSPAKSDPYDRENSVLSVKLVDRNAQGYLMRLVLPLLALFAASTFLPGQNSILPDPPHREWHAAWITHPTAPLREPLVLHFRRTLTLNAVPVSYPVRVSADN